MEKCHIEFYDFKSDKTTVLMTADADFDDTIAGGHGGGDAGIMMDLYEYIANNNPSNSISDIGISCRNHLISFAAEESRLNNSIIDMKEYENKF